MAKTKDYEHQGRNKFVTLVLLVAFIVGLLLAMATYYVSVIYLGKAEKADTRMLKLEYLLIANSLWPTSNKKLDIADLYFAENDYLNAARYFQYLPPAIGSEGYIKSAYMSGECPQVLDYMNSHNAPYTEVSKIYEAKCHLKTGDIEAARLLLAKLKKSSEVAKLRLSLLDYDEDDLLLAGAQDNIGLDRDKVKQRLYAYNLLNTASYPQAAMSLLLEGLEKNELSRDSLNLLAQAQTQLGKDDVAQRALERSLILDPYCPQTYRQLISLTEKLGTDSTEYKKKLGTLTW